MKAVAVALKIFQLAGAEAFSAIRRHPFKPLAGILYLIVIGLTERIGVGGFAGGLIRGLLITLLLSNFLAFITLLLDTRKFDWSELWQRTVEIFSPMINSLFLLFIVQLILQPFFISSGNRVYAGLFNICLFVLFNPLPEVVARRGSGGIEGFKESLEFMKENGPEWLFSLCLLFLPLLLIVSPLMLLFIFASSDPIHGIFTLLKLSVSAFFGAGGDIVGLRLFGLVFGVYYLFFIFMVRITLFEKLSTTTRRRRIYESGQ